MERKARRLKKRLRIWRIALIHAKGKALGWVTVPDAESAIKAATKELQIDNAQQKRLVAEPEARLWGQTLTGHQRRLLNEIEQIADIAKVNYPQIEAYEPNARTLILQLMRDKLVRGDAIIKYTLIDELLADIICDYYFKRKEPHYGRLWKTKPFRVFVHYIMDETYLLKKLSIVNAIRAVPRDVHAAIARINDVRNALAHSFFPQNRRLYRQGRKVIYAGVHLFGREGVTRFNKDFDLAYGYLWKRVPRAPDFEA
jgi:hypothetical protein